METSHIEQADQSEVQRRITDCITMLSDGYRRHEIVEKLSQEYGCSIRQIDDSLSRARKVLQEEAEKIRSEAFNESVATLKRLIRDLIRDRDFKGATKAQAELNKICGLDKQIIDFTGDAEINIKVTRS